MRENQSRIDQGVVATRSFKGIFSVHIKGISPPPRQGVEQDELSIVPIHEKDAPETAIDSPSKGFR